MSKKKGAYWELKAQHQLEADGYYVTKAGGSLGVFDLVAVNQTHTRLIQVKGGKRPWCSPEERAAIAAVRVHPWCIKEIWYMKLRTPVKIVRAP